MTSEQSIEKRPISSCPKSWDSLEPTSDRTRFCSECSLEVHDLAAYSRADAERLARSPERVCVLRTLRADGTLVSKPEQPTWIGRLRLLTSAAAGWVALLSTGLLGGCTDEEAEPAQSSGVGDESEQAAAEGTVALGSLKELQDLGYW